VGKLNVLNPGLVIDLVKAPGHWVTGQTSGSLVGPHDYWPGLYLWPKITLWM